MRREWRPVLGVLVAMLVLVGCGSDTLTASQLRSRATQICQLADVRTDHIPTPRQPSQGTTFLRQGIAALGPELAALGRLHVPQDLAGAYGDALDASARQLAALRSTLKGLRAGNDPVVAIKMLAQQLVPSEAAASTAWNSLQLPACRGG